MHHTTVAKVALNRNQNGILKLISPLSGSFESIFFAREVGDLWHELSITFTVCGLDSLVNGKTHLVKQFVLLALRTCFCEKFSQGWMLSSEQRNLPEESDLKL